LIITVDGTHCWIEEPTHPDWSQDKSYYSHRYNKAGINYELGIAIACLPLVWMNGPFKAGSSDGKTFFEEGLKDPCFHSKESHWQSWIQWPQR
jgi:hypothetical protein